MSEEDTPERPSQEVADVVRRRHEEALAAGMSLVEAKMFAESDIDIGRLRHLIGEARYGKRVLHCPPELLARVLL